MAEKYLIYSLSIVVAPLLSDIRPHIYRSTTCSLLGGGGMDCSIYQNYGAAEVMVQGLAGMVDQTDVEAIVRAQKKM